MKSVCLYCRYDIACSQLIKLSDKGLKNELHLYVKLIFIHLISYAE